MSIKDKYEVRQIQKEETYPWLLKKHYAHRKPSISYSFGLYDKENILNGVITYGLPPAINLYDICGEKYKKNVIELNRLIKNDDLGKNIQSWFVAQTFNLLPKPIVIISYADPNNGHVGYTYQSLNFLYTGTGGANKEMEYRGKMISMRHIKEPWFIKRGMVFDKNKTIDENFKMIGGDIIKKEQKHRYVLFVGTKREKKEMNRFLKFEVLPYPKGDNKRYDTSYTPDVQGLLF
jgi:hypothetical protein